MDLMPRAFAALVPTLVASIVSATAALAEGEVNVYTTREPGLALPLFEKFTETTDIKVNTIFIKEGLAQRVATEGANSPADILMVVDYGGLIDFVERGLTQPVDSDIVNAAVPENLRAPGNEWFALSLRARVIYASKDRVADETMTYEDLASERWQGKVCIRSGQHPYNTSLFAAIMAKHGADATRQFLADVKGNLARKAGGGDRDVARDILAGICDVGVANSYYVGLMRSGAGGQEQKAWGDAIRVILPTFADKAGTHVNISGAALAKHAPNRDNAVKLLEFLVSDEAQAIYARANYEYPVKAGVALDPLIAELGDLKIDPLSLFEVARHRKDASLLVDEVGFND